MGGEGSAEFSVATQSIDASDNTASRSVINDVVATAAASTPSSSTGQQQQQQIDAPEKTGVQEAGRDESDATTSNDHAANSWSQVEAEKQPLHAVQAFEVLEKQLEKQKEAGLTSSEFLTPTIRNSTATSTSQDEQDGRSSTVSKDIPKYEQKQENDPDDNTTSDHPQANKMIKPPPSAAAASSCSKTEKPAPTIARLEPSQQEQDTDDMKANVQLAAAITSTDVAIGVPADQQSLVAEKDKASMNPIEREQHKQLERLLDGQAASSSGGVAVTTALSQSGRFQSTPGAVRMRGEDYDAASGRDSDANTVRTSALTPAQQEQVSPPQSPPQSPTRPNHHPALIEAFQVPEIGQAVVVSQEESAVDLELQRSERIQKKRRKKKRRTNWIILGACGVVAIALGIGLGLGLNGSDNSTPLPQAPPEQLPQQPTPGEGDSENNNQRPISVDRTLQIIHSNENESGFQDINTLEEKVLHYSALVEGLRQLNAPASIHVASGDLTLQSPFYEAAAEVPSLGSAGLGDIFMMNAMKLDCTGLGNHEMDLGLTNFAKFLAAAEFPFLSVNLDFSNAQVHDDNNVPAIKVGPDASPCHEMAGMVVKSCSLETPIGTLGMIGRSPDDLFAIVEDPESTLPGLDFVGGRDTETGRPFVDSSILIKEQVQIFTDLGIDIIILLDQSFDNFNEIGEPQLTEEFAGIDIVIGEVWANRIIFAQLDNFGPFNLLREEDTADVNYPVVRRDSSGNRVLFVSSGDLYRYVGNLLVTFDENGVIASWDGRSGPIATTQEAVYMLGDVIGQDLEPNPVVSDIFNSLQNTPSILDSFAVIGNTSFPLEGQRSEIRTRETNLGRLIADSTLWASEIYAKENGLPLVDVALKNAGGIRASILGPAVTRLSIRTTLAFDNKLIILELSAGQLVAAMEHAVSQHPIQHGRFPQVAGMRVEVNATMPPIDESPYTENPSRLKTLVVEGRNDGDPDTVLVEGYEFQFANVNKTFVMATNSFLGSGGDNYVALAQGKLLSDTGIGERRILEEYIMNALVDSSINIRDPPPSPRMAFSV